MANVLQVQKIVNRFGGVAFKPTPSNVEVCIAFRIRENGIKRIGSIAAHYMTEDGSLSNIVRQRLLVIAGNVKIGDEIGVLDPLIKPEGVVLFDLFTTSLVPILPVFNTPIETANENDTISIVYAADNCGGGAIPLVGSLSVLGCNLLPTNK